MNKCPRCENEELKGNENYCPICGLNLKDKERATVIKNLKFIKSWHEMTKPEDSEQEYLKVTCINTLEYAIRELERTAQEVPVQEQYVSKCKNCGYSNKVDLSNQIELKYCMNCGEKTIYQSNQKI